MWVVSGFWLRWGVGIRTLPTRLTRHSSGRGLCFAVLRLASSAAPLNWGVRPLESNALHQGVFYFHDLPMLALDRETWVPQTLYVQFGFSLPNGLDACLTRRSTGNRPLCCFQVCSCSWFFLFVQVCRGPVPVSFALGRRFHL